MTGNIDWQRYDENDEATHPRPCQELLIMALKNGKPVFIPHAYFGLGDDHFYEAKTVRGNTVAKRVKFSAYMLTHALRDWEAAR